MKLHSSAGCRDGASLPPRASGSNRYPYCIPPPLAAECQCAVVLWPQQSFILTIWCPSQESTQVLLDPLIQGDDDRLSSLIRLTRPPSPLCSGHLGPLRCCTPPCAWFDGLWEPVCGSSRCGVFACAFRAWLLQVLLIFPLKHIAWCYAIREYCYGTVIVTNLFNNIVEVSYWKHNWRKICIWGFWNFATRVAFLFKKLCLFKNRVVEVNTLGLIFQEQR